jgi:hypothetical protein
VPNELFVGVARPQSIYPYHGSTYEHARAIDRGVALASTSKLPEEVIGVQRGVARLVSVMLVLPNLKIGVRPIYSTVLMYMCFPIRRQCL